MGSDDEGELEAREPPDSDVAFAPTLAPDDSAGEMAMAATLAAAMSADGSAPDVLTREHPGRYERRGELGRGGMGRVLEAFDGHLGRDVAMKELLTEGIGGTSPAMSVGVVTRFLREAKITGQLEHPSIVPIHELAQRADGTLYYTMKRIRGRSLAERLREAATLEARLELLGHFKDVCDAMAYAHSRGVVHRDLKPDNVMLGEFGETLVVDWGLAKVRGLEDPRASELERRVEILSASAATRTIDGHAIGTPAYMSPEQARGHLESIDERSDVWGLGAMLFELLTGRPPFEGKSALEVLHRVLEERPPRVLELAPEAPPELAAVVDRALLADPESRYPGAAQLAQEIESFRVGQRVHAYEYSAWELAKRFVAEHRAASIAGLVVSLSIVLATAVAYYSYREEAEARAIAEDRRDEAVEQRERAVTEERAARVAIAEALLERASRALDRGDPAAAAIYAAGALARDPMNPHAASAAGDEPDTESRERVARAMGVYRAATDARRYRLARRIPGATIGAALSPDGELVFAAGSGAARVSVSTGERTRLTDVSLDRVLAFLPGGRAVRGSPGAVFALASGEVLAELDGELSGAALTSEGLVLAYADGRLRLLDPADLSERASGAVAPRSQLVPVGAGSDFASFSRGTPTVWVRSASAEAPAAVELPAEPFTLAAEPGGGLLAVGLSSPAFALLSREPLAIVGAHAAEGWVTGATWLDDKRLLAAEAGREIALHHVGQHRRIATLHLPVSNAYRVLRHSDGSVIALPAPDPDRIVGASVFVPERRRDRASAGFPESAQVLAADAERGRVVVATLRGVYEVASPRRGLGAPSLLAPLPSDVGSPIEIAVASDGAIALATNLGAALVLQPGASAVTVALAARPSPIACLFGLVWGGRSGNQLLMGTSAGSIRRWRRHDGRELDPLEGHEAAVCGLAVSADGRRLGSSSCDGTARIWDIDSGASALTIEPELGALTDAVFTPDGGQLIVADTRGNLSFRDAASGARVSAVRVSDEGINRLAISHDGSRIAVADDRTIRVLDGDGAHIERWLRMRSPSLSLAFSARARFLYFTDTSVLVKLGLDSSASSESPASLLREAEEIAGVRLDGLELVPR